MQFAMSQSKHKPNPKRPSVLLVGDVEHSEFRDATALLRDTSRLTVAKQVQDAAEALAKSAPPPELILLAQSRPGAIVEADLRLLGRLAPLAGMVALVGSWCEGPARSGRPAFGLTRLCWYELPWWWRRQLAIYQRGRCPDWVRPAGVMRSEEQGASDGRQVVLENGRPATRGLIVISASDWEVGASLSDGLAQQGYATAWQPPGRSGWSLRGVTAGIWEGGQLDDREAVELAAFCRQSARDAVPVVALLDFPRYDRCQRALEAGAAVVLGKPWSNADLIAAIVQLTRQRATAEVAVARTRAA